MTADNEENRTNRNDSMQLLRQGARSAVFLKPDLMGLKAGPALVLLLVLLGFGAALVLQRVAIDGPAFFYWQAIAYSGWFTTVLVLWAAWLVARSQARGDADAATLFAVLVVQQLLITLVWWLLYFGLPHLPGLGGPALARAQWVLPYLVIGWMSLAGVVMLCRHAVPGGVRLVVVLVYAVGVGVSLQVQQTQFWYPEQSDEQAEVAEPRFLQLTQEVMERQSSVLVDSLNALQPQRPGVVDLYVLTFAPYASEDVFRRESKLVSDVMGSRFDAQGRTLQLVNHAETAGELPWASGLNLRRAILRMASLMDPHEDILFIHLTSHGARDGQLASEFFPLKTEPVTPTQLRAWLDEAGVRWRVLSISACYSGSWIAPLADPAALVMTAADAEHTSYGCGRKSELTFFGRAMYDEQLRRTRSFEAAIAAARPVIEQREKEAGKDDGYSNPQIAMGELIRPHLQALAARLDAAAP